MKVIVPVILLIGCLVGVPALPANPKPSSDDVEIIPPARYPYGDQPVVDTGVIGFGGPFSNPFSGLFENLEEVADFENENNLLTTVPNPICTEFVKDNLNLTKQDSDHLYREILRQLNVIRLKLDNVIESQDALVRKSASHSPKEEINKYEELLKIIPVKSIEELEIFENFLEDPTKYATSVDYIRQFGGRDVKECVRRTCPQLIDDLTASLFSWKGVREKKAFNKTKLSKALLGMMTRMRQQMESLFRRLPGARGNETDEFPDIPLPEGSLGILPNLNPFDNVDLSKGNTTSVTKIINGHKVVINETEYKKGDEFGQAFFKVRIIDVKPDSSELTTDENAEEVTPIAATKDREPLENSIENEIIKSKEGANFETLESFDDVDAARYAPSAYMKNSNQYVNTEWDYVDREPLEPIEDNSINFQPIDLSRDTYVNQILANAGAPTNPDAEVIFDSPQNFTEPRFRLPR